MPALELKLTAKVKGAKASDRLKDRHYVTTSGKTFSTAWTQ
jgi:hypothetical protein